MKLREIIQPHTDAENTMDVISDPTGGHLTTSIVSIYELVRNQSDNFMLSAGECYAIPYIEEILDELIQLTEYSTDRYMQHSKAGRMLTELITYFNDN